MQLRNSIPRSHISATGLAFEHMKSCKVIPPMHAPDNIIVLLSREGQLESNDAGVGLNEKFMVPYQKNPNFTGRKDMLVVLRTKAM